MKLEAKINGKPIFIVDLFINSNLVYVIYINDSDNKTKNIRKDITELSTILATDVDLAGASDLRQNISGLLNGNPVNVILFSINNEFQYYVYVDELNHLRTIKKSLFLSSYEAILLENSEYLL